MFINTTFKTSPYNKELAILPLFGHRVAAFDMGQTNTRISNIVETNTTALTADSMKIWKQKETLKDSFLQLARMFKFIKKVSKEAKNKKPEIIGISVAGPVFNNFQVIGSSSPAFHHKTPIAEILQDSVGAFTRVLNDGDAFVYAEAHSPQGAFFQELKEKPLEKQNMIGVVLGTGIGGGAIINGKLWQPEGYSAFELGNQRIHYSNQARSYKDGQGKGCWKLYASGKGLEITIAQVFNEALLDPHLRQAAEEFLKKSEKEKAEALTTFDFIARQKENNPVANKIMDQWQESLALGISNLVNTTGIKQIVIGGGLAQHIDYKDLNLKVKDLVNLPDEIQQKIKIKPSALGDSANLIGAALFAEDAYKAQVT